MGAQQRTSPSRLDGLQESLRWTVASGATRRYMTNMISVSTSKNVPHARESALAPSHHAGSIICLCSAVARGDTGGLVFLIEDKFIGSTTACMMCTSTSQRRVLYHPLAKSCYLVRGALCAIGHNSARSTSLNRCAAAQAGEYHHATR